MADSNRTAPSDVARYVPFLTSHDRCNAVPGDLGDERTVLIDTQAPATALASVLKGKADLLHMLVDYAASGTSETKSPEDLAELLLPHAEELAMLAEVLRCRVRAAAAEQAQ